MSITQILWIAGIVFVSLGLLAVSACVRNSQKSKLLRKASRENARLRAGMSHGSIMEALRDE